MKRLPKDIRFSVPANPTAKKRPLLAAIVGLGALTIYLFASALSVNRASTPSTDPLIIATTPNATPIGLLLLSDFTPTFNLQPSATSTPSPTETAKPTPSDTGTPTSTRILNQFCSVYDIRYYSMVFLANGRMQLVFDTQIDLSPYRRRNANGNLTPQLDLPGLIVWVNQSQFTDFNAFLRSPNFPNLLYIELISKENDHVSLEIIEGNMYRCSREIILPAGSALFTPSKPIGNTSPWESPTVSNSPTVTETPNPTNTATPTHTLTYALPPTPTETYSPSASNTYTHTSTAAYTRTPEPLPSASLTPTPTK